MPLILPGNVASALPTGYDVANSCMFNKGDTAYMHKTLSAGNRRTWTFSTWFKRISLGTQVTFGVVQTSTGDNNIMAMQIRADNKLEVWDYAGGITAAIVTNRLFRDISAWYHVVVAADTTSGTANNRLRLYINGTEERGVGGYATDTMPSQNLDFNINQNTKVLKFGAYDGGSVGSPADFYFAETVFIDGTQYAASDFGEFDEDSPTIWKPKKVSGLTFGTNGFYLDYEDSSNLGNDANGGTDLTEVNLAATDSSTDSPTNNFATLNPLFHGTNLPTFREGNLEVEDTAQDAYQGAYSTIQVPTTGLWYWEIKNASGTDIGGSTEEGAIGGVYESRISTISDPSRITYTTQELSKFISGGAANLDDGEIAGILVDRNNAEMKIYIDDSLYATISSVTAEPIFPFGLVFANSGTCKLQFNFGNPIHSISSGNTDPGGYGNFEFSTKSGYALCTKNLNN